MSCITRRGALLAALATPSVARAQAGFPRGPVRIISPFAAGGPTDLQGRVVAERLSQKWSQPVVVENRLGAGGSIGSAAVARAAPDGQTLLVQGSAHVTNAPLFPNLPYHPIDDFTPIFCATVQPMILTVHPSFPARDLASFIAMARARPEGISAGIAGAGAISHLAGVLLEQMAEIRLLTVPFTGAAPAQAALLGGQINCSFLNSTVATQLIQSGQLRGLGCSALRRWRDLPDVPTIAEQGFPGFDCTSWYGFLGPARMPEELLRRIHADMAETMQIPEARARLMGAGLDPLELGPEAFRALMAADLAKWTAVIRRANIQL